MFTVNVYIKGADKASYIKSTFNILKSEFKKRKNASIHKDNKTASPTDQKHQSVMLLFFRTGLKTDINLRLLNSFTKYFHFSYIIFNTFMI